MATLCFHYDKDPSNMCEMLTLTTPAPGREAAVAVPHMVVLVSSSLYRQKKAQYAGLPNCRVYPLLFSFRQLSAPMLKEVSRRAVLLLLIQSPPSPLT